VANIYKDGVREHPALDPADLTFAQKLQLARGYKARLPTPREIADIRRARYGAAKYDADRWDWERRHPLQAYMDMEEDHYNQCVTYGCGCAPVCELVDGKVVVDG